MGKFSLKGHFPILEFKFMRGPMVLIKIGDRQLELRKATRHQGKYFITKEGVFELDGEYSYNLAGQQLLIYNLFNSKPISITGIEKVQKLYRDRKASVLVRELERINNAVESGAEKKYTDPIHAMAELYKGKPEELSRQTQKYLIDSRLFDKDDLKLLNTEKMNSKNVNKGLSLKVPTIIPLLLMSVIAMTIVGIMSQVNPLKWFN